MEVSHTFSGQTFDNRLFDLGRAMLEEGDDGIVLAEEYTHLLDTDGESPTDKGRVLLHIDGPIQVRTSSKPLQCSNLGCMLTFHAVLGRLTRVVVCLFLIWINWVSKGKQTRSWVQRGLPYCFHVSSQNGRTYLDYATCCHVAVVHHHGYTSQKRV